MDPEVKTLKQRIEELLPGQVAVKMDDRNRVGIHETDSIDYLKVAGFPVSHLLQKPGYYYGVTLPKKLKVDQEELAMAQVKASVDRNRKEEETEEVQRHKTGFHKELPYNSPEVVERPASEDSVEPPEDPEDKELDEAIEASTQSSESTGTEINPKALATELGISPAGLRRKLRTLFGKSGKRWHLTAEQIEQLKGGKGGAPEVEPTEEEKE